MAVKKKEYLPIRARFRHVGATGQPLCGAAQFLKEILFKVKKLAVNMYSRLMTAEDPFCGGRWAGAHFVLP